MFTNIKPTPAMQFVAHSLLSVFIGALVSGLTIVAQNAFTGTANLQTVLGMGLAGFGVYFSTNINKLWSNPQTAQAALDAANEAKALATQVAAGHQYLQGAIHALTAQQLSTGAQPAQPPVTVHVTSPAPATATPAQAPIEAQPTQSVPAVSAQAAPIAPPFTLPTNLPTFSSAMPAMPRQ